MTLRPSTRRTAVRWLSLPPEIRLMILEAIAEQRHPGWASLASVCKEWQLVLEKRNFQRLKLQVSCLDDFERLVVRQRELVRHIQFDVELQKYTCRSCKWDESNSWSRRNSSIFNNGISKLFRILSTWGLQHDLTLELNAHSPSDSEHWFKKYYFASDDEGSDGGVSARETDPGRNWHDPWHGWVNGEQVRAPPAPAIMRLFERIDPYFHPELPRINAVTCLIIRRQLRRRLFPLTLELILSKLDYLEHLVYEPWRQWEGGWVVLHDKRRYPVPPPLRRCGC
jgi:hypothetical protein